MFIENQNAVLFKHSLCQFSIGSFEINRKHMVTYLFRRNYSHDLARYYANDGGILTHIFKLQHEIIFLVFVIFGRLHYS